MTNGKGASVVMTIRINADELERLRAVAEANHRTISGEVRFLIGQHVAEYGKAA